MSDCLFLTGACLQDMNYPTFSHMISGITPLGKSLSQDWAPHGKRSKKSLKIWALPVKNDVGLNKGDID